MKRVLSVLLALCLLLGTLPVLASAKGINRYEKVLNQLISERVGSKMNNGGIYYDINGDGIEEMLILRERKQSNGIPALTFSLYAVVDGAAECLLKDYELYLEVGGPTAKVQVVTKGGNTYLALNSEGGGTSGIHFRRNGTWTLYAMDAATDTLKKKSTVKYTAYRGYTYSDDKVYVSESFATIDGKKVSWTAYEAWVKSLTVKTELDTGISALFGKKNQTFEQLLRKAQADTTGDLPTTSVAGFKDVKIGAYYADPVAWAVEKGITSGVGGGKFGPGNSCTREQIVTFLWNDAGKPEPSSIAGFKDMPKNEAFKKAISWAAENEITAGYAGNVFRPGKACTRAEAMTFIWRAHNKPEPKSAASFTDLPDNSDFQKAISWAYENKILAGDGKGHCLPGKTCSRAEIVSFLYRAKDI